MSLYLPSATAPGVGGRQTILNSGLCMNATHSDFTSSSRERLQRTLEGDRNHFRWKHVFEIEGGGLTILEVSLLVHKSSSSFSLLMNV